MCTTQLMPYQCSSNVGHKDNSPRKVCTCEVGYCEGFYIRRWRIAGDSVGVLSSTVQWILEEHIVQIERDRALRLHKAPSTSLSLYSGSIQTHI